MSQNQPPNLQFPISKQFKSSSVAPSASSPYLRTPQSKSPDKQSIKSDVSGDSLEDAITKAFADIKNKDYSYVDKQGISIANDLKFATTQRQNSESKVEQFDNAPLIPKDSAKNTMFIKAPRNRSNLINTKTSFDRGPWTVLSRIMTCCFPNFIIRRCGMKTPQVIQAWREKVTLCLLFTLVMVILAFITFFISSVLCPTQYNVQIITKPTQSPVIPSNAFIALGQVYKYDYKYTKIGLDYSSTNQEDISTSIVPDTDAFQSCTASNINVADLCRGSCILQSQLSTQILSQIRYDWDVISKSKSLFVYNGNVIDINKIKPFSSFFPILLFPGTDMTALVRNNQSSINLIKCISESFKIGFIDTTSFGCLTRDILTNVAMITILGLIFIRFVLAISYAWFISRDLQHTNTNNKVNPAQLAKIKDDLSRGVSVNNIAIPVDYRLIHSILMVTCYSEDKVGLKTTLDSLGSVNYPNKYKLIIVICDGLVTGGGQTMSTPDIVLSLINANKDIIEPRICGQNMAKIYSGTYEINNTTTNIIVIVKCGLPGEQGKLGNRGKRDSQLLLMDFFRVVMFNDLMNPFQYELFNKIYKLTGNTADKYEILLFVDADTRLDVDALTHMTAVVGKDPMIMGLCGETRIMNKNESWVTKIQVFEYHISHHLAKSFESCFGGVTCLPGCFCMYRIKAPRDDGTWTPILASPEIFRQYSETVVNTLHKKNLLLLGEDRFLSTLMLRTFPNRKMMFVPKAVCKTSVPSSFKVLLSQRRRWINSTIHNLFELLLVNELCGTFCFSMQFVVFLELIGTVSLPAAILFTV